MKFGVPLYPYSTFGDLPALREFTVRAESLYFDSAQIPDHIAYPVHYEKQFGGPYWEAVVLAAHLGSVTTRIRFGFAVLVIPQRNPVLLARQLATVDQITEGRIDVGVGLGWLPDEYRVLGAPFEARGVRFDEYLQVMKCLWADRPASFAGQYCSFAEVSPGPRVVQRPHPPIWLGGTLPSGNAVPKSVRRAARFADGWCPMPGRLTQLRDGISMLRDALIAEGRDPEGFPVRHRLPMWQRSAEANKHVQDGGGGLADELNGDFAKAAEYIAECEKIGVTHLAVGLPPGRGQLDDALVAFSEEIIQPLIKTSSSGERVP